MANYWEMEKNDQYEIRNKRGSRFHTRNKEGSDSAKSMNRLEAGAVVGFDGKLQKYHNVGKQLWSECRGYVVSLKARWGN